MIYVINSKRRYAIYLINSIGLLAWPFYRLLKRTKGLGEIRQALENGRIKTIAFNAVDRLGDLLFMTPLVKAVKNAYPGIRLIVITNKMGNEVFKSNPYIDEIIIAENRWIGKSLVNPIEFLQSFNADFFKMIKDIRGKNIDLLVEVKGDFRNIIFFDIFLGAKYLLGYALSGFGWMLDHETGYRIGSHEIDAKLKIAKELGIDITDRTIEFHLSEADLVFARKFFGSHRIDENAFKVVVHAGGTWQPRQWPIGNFIQLAEKLIKEKNAKIIIIGDKREKDLIDEFMKAVPDAVRADNFSIPEVAALIKQADLFVGNDSGPMHIARAVKTPLIGIFGPEKLDRVGPEEYGIAIRHDYPCSPCGQVKCNIHPNCVESILVEEVWEAVKKLEVRS